MSDEHWLLSYIGTGATAVDIGANVGDWSRLLAGRFANVVAVEPDARAFESLSATVPANVRCVHAAATDVAGPVELHCRESPLQSSLLRDHPIGASACAAAPIVVSQSVPGTTLDELVSDASFVKVDVEGHEGAVLAGATKEFFRRCRWLIEVHDREAEVVAQLRRLGYENHVVIKHPSPTAHPKHFWIYADR